MESLPGSNRRGLSRAGAGGVRSLGRRPGGDYVGWSENIAFCGPLWATAGVSMMLIRFAADRLGVKAEERLDILEKAV